MKRQKKSKTRIKKSSPHRPTSPIGGFDFAMIKLCIEHLIHEHLITSDRLFSVNESAAHPVSAYQEYRRQPGVELTPLTGLSSSLEVCSTGGQLANGTFKDTVEEVDYARECLEVALKSVASAERFVHLNGGPDGTRGLASYLLCWPRETVGMVGGTFYPFDLRTLHGPCENITPADEKRQRTTFRRLIKEADVILALDRFTNRVGLIYGDDGFQKILQGRQSEAGRLMYVSIDEQHCQLDSLVALTMKVKGSVSKQVTAAMGLSKALSPAISPLR